MPIFSDPFAKVTCTYCQDEINGVRVKCCECTDFDICLQCFSVGAEIGPHRNDHSYKFIDQCNGTISGGKSNWTGREHFELLNAVERSGFGNWELVSERVETKTPEEVKEEYISRYMEGNIGRATWGKLANHRPRLIDHTVDDDGPLSPNATAKLPPLQCTPDEARLLGYKPHRDDYEREYNMLAEQLVAKLQLKEENNSMEVALKLSIVDMYIRQIRERARRKRIVRDYQLVSKYFQNLKDPNKTVSTISSAAKQEKDLCESMRVFAQFITSGEHERLIASLERERELRHRLSELYRYRSLGLMTEDDIMHYEQHAAFERQQQSKQNRTSGSSGHAMREEQLRNENGKINSNSIVEKCMSPIRNVAPNGCSNSNSCSFNNNNWNSTNSANVSDSKVVDDGVGYGMEEPPIYFNRRLPFEEIMSYDELQLCFNLNW